MENVNIAEQTKAAKKAGVASFVGTTIEWYDFYAYSTAAALVFGKIFFPSIDSATGTLAAFATFWIGFLARPLGGIIFGHLGDRIGRKKTLIVTLMLMGVCTTAIGLLPTYNSIGITAPILLVLLRLIQGIAMGGEWGGAVVLSAEHAPKGKELLYSAFAQQGSPVGNLLATFVFFMFSFLPDEQFLSWGWRIPFLFSALLVLTGLWIRLGVEESPVMQQLKENKTLVKVPLTEVLKKYKMMVFLGMCACIIGLSATYFKTTFALSWAVNDIGFSRSDFLGIVTIALITQVIFQPFGAIIASKINLKKAIIFILLPEIILLPFAFLMIATKSYLLAAIGMAVATIPHSMYYSFLGGILVKAFPANVRYTGISLSYQLCGMIFAGSTPIIAQTLLNQTGSIISVIILAVIHVIISMVAAVYLISKYEAATRTFAATKPMIDHV
ncbi:MFS transporter [Acinetobacter stercoris]|uniref:Inner membrane metabolite transport protein YhjE n=1 Tax=Acinetobacter stercoris TaxID=2126983 RepID=A0A2U3N0R4_9GAMM|nr:MFS transporter [Acinetobacter stercoris]SPL71276.1 Inner membrane metabolite transport protein YhjE [Acinetobacter stercoris]